MVKIRFSAQSQRGKWNHRWFQKWVRTLVPKLGTKSRAHMQILIVGPKIGPNFGTNFGSRFWDHLEGKTLKILRFLVHFLVPRRSYFSYGLGTCILLATVSTMLCGSTSTNHLSLTMFRERKDYDHILCPRKMITKCETEQVWHRFAAGVH